MLQLPDFSKAFDYENDFYLSCDTHRLGKFIAHYELFRMAQNLPGAMVECGVFKGVSFTRFASFRDLFGSAFSCKLIGFDIFGDFPATQFEEDIQYRERFIKAAGASSIAVEQLKKVLQHKGIDKNIELIAGDITKTLPEYIEKNPQLKVSLINLDTDIYEPSVTILEYLYPRLVKGGVLILDDYGTFPGETKAVDDYFKGQNIRIQKFPFAMTPCYIIKE
ncbi:MAG: TylF/MycF/NovP-related O-methyltransferase [Spirosomataceae bacterium]